MGEAPLKPSLIFPLFWGESDHGLLISYVNQSLMTASDGMKELDGFSFGIKAPNGLQPKGFESILHPIVGFMGWCILHENNLDYFDEGHPQNSPKIWLNDEVINFYIFWT